MIPLNCIGDTPHRGEEPRRGGDEWRAIGDHHPTPPQGVLPAARVLKQIDLARLQSHTDTMPQQEISASDFIRAMRDADRY